MAATKEITSYWLEDSWKDELNPQNPLGWQGKIAQSYAELVKEIYSNKYKMVVPRDFKQAIGEFAPRFSGYNQQDSSELLSFLLDGIHEDLNRCLEKPYTEAVEDKGRPDSEVAQEAWETHLKRHDSIIVDKFQGQYKSRVACPKCDKVSITFDPFMFLSVPLPTVKTKNVEITVVYSDPDKPNKVFGITAPKLGTVMELKKSIAQKTGLPLQRLLVGEIWKSRVYKFYKNNYLMGDIRGNDDVWCWEIPSLEDEKAQEAVERDREYDFLQLLMVRSKEDKYMYMREKRLVCESFGLPLACKIPADGKISGSELTRRVNEAVAPFVKGDGDCPYVIRILDYNGRTVKSNLEDSEDILDFSMTRSSIGVDWIDTDRYNSEKLENTVLDDSAPSKNKGMGNMRRKAEAIQLNECFDVYVEEETLSEDNMWYCSGCKDFVCGTKKFDLWKLPPVLIIHLKRFQFSRMYRDKIDTFVDFPLEGLDLSDYVINPDNGSCVYDCYAVSNHMGGLGGGHYTAYAKSQFDGEWYELDDSRTSKASADQIKSSAAYVLFYQLRENSA
jgi:ubiquitin carboxyl-terminal hydrolase 4/11/15